MLIPDDKKYDVIVADPPWAYNFSKSNSRKIENQYDTMSIDEIKALNVQDLCQDHTILYLWGTAPKLVEGLDVLLAWGFTYKSNMVWHKSRLGCGYWSRVSHEHILIGTTGSPAPPEPEQRKSSVIESPSKKHSEKPEVFIDWVDMWYPQADKIELFARRRRLGWDFWGNEA